MAARDGVKDTVDCGTGTDSGVFDAPGVDSVTGCESSVFRDLVVRFLLKAQRQKVKKGGVAIALRCPEEDCTSRATATGEVLGRRTIRFRTITLKQPRGQRFVVVLKLSKRNLARVRRALRARKRLTVRLTVTVTDAAGNRASRRVSFRLRR